jgi:hypothetical protein
MSRYRRVGAKDDRRYSPYSFLTLALYGVSCQRHALAALYPRRKDPLVAIVHNAGAGLDTEARETPLEDQGVGGRMDLR